MPLVRFNEKDRETIVGGAIGQRRHGVRSAYKESTTPLS